MDVANARYRQGDRAAAPSCHSPRDVLGAAGVERDVAVGRRRDDAAKKRTVRVDSHGAIGRRVTDARHRRSDRRVGQRYVAAGGIGEVEIASDRVDTVQCLTTSTGCGHRTHAIDQASATFSDRAGRVQCDRATRRCLNSASDANGARIAYRDVAAARFPDTRDAKQWRNIGQLNVAANCIGRVKAAHRVECIQRGTAHTVGCQQGAADLANSRLRDRTSRTRQGDVVRSAYVARVQGDILPRRGTNSTAGTADVCIDQDVARRARC